MGGATNLQDHIAPSGAIIPTSHHIPGLASWARVCRPSETQYKTLNKYIATQQTIDDDVTPLLQITCSANDGTPVLEATKPCGNRSVS
jgi:hypothetical protein